METLFSTAVSLEYASSDDPAELDQGIRNTIRGIGLSILTVGLALVRMKAEKHFLGLGYKNLTSYVESLAQESKYDRGTIFTWLKIGETWLKHREDLEKMGYDPAIGATKLAHLDKALSKRPKTEVYDNLLIMSFREFRDYAGQDAKKKKKKLPFWEIRGNILYINGKRAAIVNRNIGARNVEMIIAALEAAAMALERQGYILAVHLDSYEELMRFKAIARRERNRMRGLSR